MAQRHVWYHNRGETTFHGENSVLGDFAGLYDPMTSSPRVVQGMIEIFGSWIDHFKVDGFRIDTARHVNPEFWQAFVPATQDRAKANRIPNFHIFGEVFDSDPGNLARFTRVDGFAAVLDFGFQSAVADMTANNKPRAQLAAFFAKDVRYEGGADAALQLPTFPGNHDMAAFPPMCGRPTPLPAMPSSCNG